MEFRDKQAIYLQIADYFAARILDESWLADEKVPSVRQLAVELEVNPNTVMRAYTHLQDSGVIYNKRGIGYFVDPQAKSRLQENLRDKFIQEELKSVFQTMTLLGLKLSDLTPYYESWLTEQSKQENNNENQQ